MSWKEKRLITVLSIILAVLCAAVLVVLSIRYRAAQAAKEAGDQTSQADIAQAAQSQYVALSYENGSVSLSFALNEEGVWYWESEPDFPLDDTAVRAILDQMTALRAQQTLDLPADLSEYGLDDPAVTLTATAPDGGVVKISMGNATTDGSSYYALINSDPDHLFIISDALYQAMQTPIYAMCRLPELPVLAEESITSIRIQGPAGETEGEETAVGPITVLTAAHGEDGATTWRSGGANVTDTADVRALMEDLAALKVTACVDFRPSDEAAALCGFSDPAVLTVDYLASGNVEEVFEMSVGTQNMDGTGRYVRFGQEDAVYLMELSLLDPLMRLAYQGMEGA